MWVFCAGMPRSGSTLQYQLVAEIVERQGIGRRIGFVEPRQFTLIHDRQLETDELLVVKTHSFLSEANQLCESKQALVLCIHRDLRDVVVSLHGKNGTPIEDIIEKGQLHTCVADFESWTSLPGSMVMSYEQITRNLSDSVGQIAKHLGVNLDKREREEIAIKYSREKQKERIMLLRDALQAKGQEAGYDSHSLLHQNHINSSKSGQWQQNLAPDQVENIEANFGTWLDENGYIVKINSEDVSDDTVTFSRFKRLGRYLFPSGKNGSE